MKVNLSRRYITALRKIKFIENLADSTVKLKRKFENFQACYDLCTCYSTNYMHQVENLLFYGQQFFVRFTGSPCMKFCTCRVYVFIFILAKQK